MGAIRAHRVKARQDEIMEDDCYILIGSPVTA